MKKDQTIQQISLAVFSLEASKGHLKWKVTDLEKNSQFSRSLIYRYMGKSKEEILKSALSVFTWNFYGFSPEGRLISFGERIKAAREMLIENPTTTVFYQKWRAKESWVQEELIKVEKKFQLKLKKLYPGLSNEDVWKIHGYLHGLVTAPFLNPEQTQKAAEDLEKTFLK